MKKTIHKYVPIGLFCVLCFLISCIMPPKKRKKDKRRKPLNNISSKTRNKKKKENKFSLINILVSEQKRKAIKCPTGPVKAKTKKGRITTDEENRDKKNGARLQRKSRSIQFDIIELEEYKLDIPAFKQFLNNHTDFTEDGEEQFKEIIKEIREYIGPINKTGKNIHLRVVGSASQIPTSFDPSKPNNNIRPDGSSIPGRTSIENNKKLAQARALELAKKIKEIFIEIEIETPKLKDIKLGKTIWDKSAQRRLNDAHLRNDLKGKAKVYEPYQKEQYVKVESKESKMRTIKPNAIKMYVAYAVPRMTYHKENDSTEVGRFIISENTYKVLGRNSLEFKNYEQREAFLKKHNLHIYLEKKPNGEKRWYLLQGHHERHTFRIHKGVEQDRKRLFALYELGIVNDKDKVLLEEIITERYLRKHKELKGHNVTFEEEKGSDTGYQK